MSKKKSFSQPRIPPFRCWGAPRNCLPAPQTEWKILHQQQDCLWVSKPGQLQIHPSKPSDPCTLWDLLQRYYAFEWVTKNAQISILTRLDRETSGVTLIALSKEKARNLGKLIQNGKLKKEYLAIAHGWPKQDLWNVDIPLTSKRNVDPSSPILVEQTTHKTGKPAQTSFQVLQRFQSKYNHKLCLLKVTPKTGRMHQIRVHACYSGHPLLGDKIYGQPASTYLRWIEEGWTSTLANRLLLPRQALHCHALTFANTRVECPLPEGLQKLLPNQSPN